MPLQVSFGVMRPRHSGASLTKFTTYPNCTLDSQMPKKSKKATSKAPETLRGRKSTHTSSKPARSKATSAKASSVLRDGRSAKTAKSAAGSALSQRSASRGKWSAGSALSQIQNPRSGMYVKIDRVAGTIVAHKKSAGAYKGIPIVGKKDRRS